MYRRAASRPQKKSLPPLAQVLSGAREARRRRYSWMSGTFHPEVAALGAHLPDDSLERPLFFSIGGPLRRMATKRAALEARMLEFLDGRARRMRASRRK